MNPEEDKAEQRLQRLFQKQRLQIVKLVGFSFLIGIIQIFIYDLVNKASFNIITLLFSSLLFYSLIFISDKYIFRLKDLSYNKPYSSFPVTFYIFGQITGYIISQIFIHNDQKYLTFYIWLSTQVVYHIGEFFFVCFCHFHELSFKSFLINHSKYYSAAVMLCIIEHSLEVYVFDLQFKQYRPMLWIGLIVSSIGQVFRLGAFISARSNFHHLIQRFKSEKHELVTDGIYSISRHPSYFGFFLQSVGGQILLVNPFCIFAYIGILYYFFFNRIYFEELFLVQFFGNEYIEYRKKVSVLIPFLDKKLAEKREKVFRERQQYIKLNSKNHQDE